MKTIRLILIFASLATCGLCVAGCAAFGVIAADAAGNSAVPAEYVPPKEPTLVLVENYRAAAGGDVDCDRLGRVLSQQLTEHDVVPLVDFAKLTTLRDHDPEAYRKMSVEAIGQSVGAKQVIYVNLSDYTPDTPIGGEVIKWKADVKVKVIEAATGQSRWPVDLAEGEPLSAETDYTKLDATHSDWMVRDDLNKKLADRVAKLFYQWEKDSDDASDYRQGIN